MFNSIMRVQQVRFLNRAGLKYRDVEAAGSGIVRLQRGEEDWSSSLGPTIVDCSFRTSWR
jgi:hypothetical protein